MSAEEWNVGIKEDQGGPVLPLEKWQQPGK